MIKIDIITVISVRLYIIDIKINTAKKQKGSKTLNDFHEKRSSGYHSGSGIMGATYFMAFIGAAVYYISQTHTFWTGVLGFLKAAVWPAMLIYKLFEFLSM